MHIHGEILTPTTTKAEDKDFLMNRPCLNVKVTEPLENRIVPFGRI